VTNFVLGVKPEKDFKWVKMSLEKYLKKEIKKNRKGKGGASRLRPRFWPAGQSRPSPLARHPPPRASARASVHARTAVPRRLGGPAELGRRVVRMRRGGRTLVGHQVCPAAPASSPAARRAPPLSLSPSPSPARSSNPRHRLPLPSALGAPFSGSSGLLPPIRDHQRLCLVLPHPALVLNRAR